MKKFIEKFATLIVSAFGLVAALAWNEAIKTFIQKYISPGKEVQSLFIYAFVVTIIAVFVSIYISKLAKKLVSQEERIARKLEATKKDKEKCELKLMKEKTKNKK